MKFNFKNFIIGFIAGIITTILFLFLIGDVNIETEFEFGCKQKNNHSLYLIEVSL
tara:strand:+ start:1023 stop:1187 length:165 start_codon:yes stop_codon:yes gene_type:complete